MKSSIESYIASKDPGSRSNEDLLSLLPWFRKYGKNVLKDATNEVLVEILQSCTYEKFIMDKIIILEGEIGDSFYILMEGKVSIYVRDSDYPSDDFKRKRPSLNNKEFRNFLGRCVLTEGEGYSFGEYALMEEDRVRNASVVAAEDCSVIVVNLSTYNNNLKHLERNILIEREEFIKNNALFKDYNTNIKNIIKMSLKKVIIPYQSNIVTQGDKCNGLMFITKGSGQLIIEVNKHETQYPEYFPLDFTQYDQQLNEFTELKLPPSKSNRTEEEEVIDGLTSRLIHLKRSKDYAAVENYIQHSNSKLCTVQAGEIIGDVELLFNLKTNLYSINCLEETEAFILEAVHIERILKNTNPNSIYDRLKRIIGVKLDYREKYFTKIPIPFMLFLKNKLYFKTIQLSKEYPKMITTKELPTLEEEWQHLLKMYGKNRAELIFPYIRGSVYLKDLMKRNAYLRKKTKIIQNVDIQFSAPSLDSFPIRQESVYRLQKMSRDPVHLMELIQKETTLKVKRPKFVFHLLSRVNTQLSNDDHPYLSNDNTTSKSMESSFTKLKTVTEKTLLKENSKKLEVGKRTSGMPTKEYISNLQSSQVKFLNNFCSEKSQYDIEINKPKLNKKENIRTHFLPNLPYENKENSKDLSRDGTRTIVKQQPKLH